MSNKETTKHSYKITIDKSIIEQSLLDEKEAGKMVVKDGQIRILFGKQKKAFDIPFLSYMLPSVLLAGLFMFLFRDMVQIPLSGDRSIASAVIIGGIVSGMICFAYFYSKDIRQEKDKHNRKMYFRNLPAVLFSFTIILGITLLVLFEVLNNLFIGTTFDLITSTVFVMIILTVINYLMIFFATTLTTAMLIRTLSLFIIGGVAISMLMNRDQQWWTANFSFLGTPEAINSWQFNLTLILSALIMIALIDFLFVDIYRSHEKTKRLTVLKTLLIATALCLGGVGLFPHNDIPFFQMMHNQVAGFLVYLVIILILGLRWFLPKIPKDLYRLSLLIGGLLVISSLLFQPVGYLSLTAFELISFALAFAWLILLFQYLVYYSEEYANTYIVTLESE